MFDSKKIKMPSKIDKRFNKRGQKDKKSGNKSSYRMYSRKATDKKLAILNKKIGS